MTIEEEAANLVIEMDEPTPVTSKQVDEFCARSSEHRKTYEAIARCWAHTLVIFAKKKPTFQ